jgi:hypothetical protein
MSNLSLIKLIPDLTRHGQMASPGYSENVDFKNIKMKTFEWITSKIHSKLGGYTQHISQYLEAKCRFQKHKHEDL